MGERVIALEVKGMSCEGCVNNVSNALKSVNGVRRVEVNLGKENATVWCDEEKASEDKLKRAVIKAGYLVGDIHQQR
jgi:copper chaperone CopZ